jgi:hypothetical protein
MFKFKTAAKMRFISRLVFIFCALSLGSLYLFSYYGQQTGDFTIDVSQDAFLDKNMVLSETIDFQTKNSRLTAKPIGNVYPIGQYGAPEKIPIEIEASIEEFQSGSNNGLNYFAYTFYVKNDGKADFSYNLSIYIEDAQKNIDSAIRIMVICEKDITNKKTITSDVYAKVQGQHGEYPGEPEPGSKPFIGSKKVVDTNRYDFNIGQIDKYTVVMWLHGEDPDCVDIEGRSIRGGLLKVSMKFNIINL